MNQYYVYIMANKSKTLYTGITNNLERRVYEHKQKLVPGFTARYNITKLVHYEETTDVLAAIAREKEIKGWLRSKKIKLIELSNPDWHDLATDWYKRKRPFVTLRVTSQMKAIMNDELVKKSGNPILYHSRESGNPNSSSSCPLLSQE